jgi:hypothetical protein
MHLTQGCNPGYAEQCSSIEGQEEPVTFQIAMVGSDGLVIGSDSLCRYAIQGEIPQRYTADKHFVSPNGSLFCFAAGTNTTLTLARQISVKCEDVSVEGLSDAINAICVQHPTPTLVPDEILIAKMEMPNAFWFMRRGPESSILIPPLFVANRRYFCTGTKTQALFLPRHLWNPERSVAALKKLALLTLSYAAHEEPGSVGPPFTIMTLDWSGRVEWTKYEKPLLETFQGGLEHLLTQEQP